MPEPVVEATRRYRLHIENLRALPEMFHATPERYEAVARRHADLARRIDPSIGWDEDVFATAIAEAEILVGWNLPRHDLIRAAPRLRMIQLAGAGIDHLLPLGWLPPAIQLVNNRGVHAHRAGEYAVMAVLALNNRLPWYADCKVGRCWLPEFQTGVAGKTILIVGVGGLGEAAAERCKGLGMRVIGVRASARPSPWVDEMVGPDDLMAVLGRADVLLLTMPLTDSTRCAIGRDQLQAMKPGSGLINMARAGVLDHAALDEALRAGHLSGAFLDVADPEPPPPEAPIWSLPRTIITPHVSCDDPERYMTDSLEILFDNLEREERGEPIRNLVNVSRQY